MTIYDFCIKVKKACNLFFVFVIKKSLCKCGKHSKIGLGSRFIGIKNISIGNNCSIGEESLFITTKAKVIIGDDVIFAPRVTVVSGNHRLDMKNRLINSVKDNEKLPENDADVIFEGDNWIGTGAIILKGVTVGRGSVVAAGSVVTKNVEPFSIVGGCPAKKIKMRFEKEA